MARQKLESRGLVPGLPGGPALLHPSSSPRGALGPSDGVLWHGLEPGPTSLPVGPFPPRLGPAPSLSSLLPRVSPDPRASALDCVSRGHAGPPRSAACCHPCPVQAETGSPASLPAARPHAALRAGASRFHEEGLPFPNGATQGSPHTPCTKTLERGTGMKTGPRGAGPGEGERRGWEEPWEKLPSASR